MTIISTGKDNVTIQQIAEKHWEILNPKLTGTNNYKYHSLVKRFERLSQQLESHNEKAFFDLVLKNNYAFLKKLITCRIEEMDEIIENVEAFLAQRNLNNSDFRNMLLNTAFQYENWRESIKSFNLFELINIEACPYCNLNLIYRDVKRGITVVNYDHFYDKVSYPYLCLSFSNIIPVCSVCNHTYKGTLSFKISSHIHPYYDDYNEICQFDTDYFEGCDDYTINLTLANNDDRCNKFNEDLSIESRYRVKNVKKNAKLIFNQSRAYSRERLDGLIEDFTFISPQDLEIKLADQIDYPYHTKDILNNQYGKIKRDLAKKYGLLTTIP